MKLLGSALALSSVLFASSLAYAQGAPPDVVRLRDGSMYRGTIAELVANDHVVIVGVDGQMHRFAMKDVASAGPASAPAPAAAPAAPPPPPPPPPPGEAFGPGAQVRFEANDADVQLHVRTGQAQIVGWAGRGAMYGEVHAYASLCTAPCTATVPTGTQHLGLSANGGAVVESSEPVVVTGPGTLVGTYTSHKDVRIGGLLVMLGSVTVGAVLTATSFHTSNVSCDTTGTGSGDTCGSVGSSFDGTKFAVGMVVAVVGGVVGTVMMLRHDDVTFSFVPMAAGLNVGPREMQRAPELNAQGLAVQARF